MLHTLHIKNFTVFSDVQFDFSPGLNVIIGDNGTGKSHLLYLAYVVDYIWHEALQNYLHTTQNKDKESWQRDLAHKLTTVFRPDKLGRLCRRQQPHSAEIKMVPFLEGHCVPNLTRAFSFFVTAINRIKLEQAPSFSASEPPKKQLEPLKRTPLPLFFPIKEVLSFYPDFMKSFKERKLAFYAIYYDLCQALTAGPLTFCADEMAELGRNLENILQGSVIVEFDHFYLQHSEYGKMEMSLVPEGLRKIAMLTYLIKKGGLAKGSTLFWDEPETNLNAKLQVKLVDTLVALVNAGVQVVLTTHDLFLMKELSLRVDAGETEAHFFELLADKSDVRVVQGDNLDDLFTITALEATLEQDDREQEIFYRELEQVSA
ncbi:MAG: AAA family ATPase [Candidatus Parabeggiatoa sp.]|nr:AAA family ATPase [Candidatus Parabeggiatoa sp.]